MATLSLSALALSRLLADQVEPVPQSLVDLGHVPIPEELPRIVEIVRQARERGLAPQDIDTDELLVCLLRAALGE